MCTCFICLQMIENQVLKCQNCNLIFHQKCMEIYVNKALTYSLLEEIRDPFICPQCTKPFTYESELVSCCIPLLKIDRIASHDGIISLIAVVGYLFIAIILFLQLDMTTTFSAFVIFGVFLCKCIWIRIYDPCPIHVLL